MNKLSECQGYKEKILTAWSYCKEKDVLGDLSDIGEDWETIDDRIRFKYGARLERVPVTYYLDRLKERIESEDKRLTRQSLSLDQMALALYKYMENHLPDKKIDGRETVL